MGRYIVLYRAPATWMDARPNVTPEDMKEGLAAWMAWAEKCGDGLVDMGSPLGGGRRMTAAGSSASDAGFVGYSILEAEDMAGAQALLEGHPHLAWAEGCEIEVHEAMAAPA